MGMKKGLYIGGLFFESQRAAARALPEMLRRTLTPASAKEYVRIAVGYARCGVNRIKLLNRLWVSETEPEKS
jgi:hypothetical protein